MGVAIPEFRKPVMTWVEASWEDPSGAWHKVPARMEDKSAGGACIRLKTKIGVGAKLRIQWRFENFSGTAKYCRSEGREYLVGIQRDLTEAPNRTPPVPETPAAQKSPPLSTVNTQSLPHPLESKPKQTAAQPNVEKLAAVHVATAATAMPAGGVGYEDRNRDDGPRFRPRDVRALRRREIPTQQPPLQADKERKSMARKWLELPWSKKPDLLSGVPEIADRNREGKSDKEKLMSHVNQTTEKASVHAAREVPTFQVELAPMEDIYRAAGIMIPRKGYSIKKVVDMLNSQHMSGLSKEMKRVALLMALDAAGVPIDEVLRDAGTRQQALDTYEAAQKKQVEAEWARKAEEVVQIQSELESIKAHYAARISRSLEGVALEKATFNGWLTLKLQECQSMAEAAELCMKAPAPESASPLPTVSLVKATAASASGAGQESQSDAIHQPRT